MKKIVITRKLLRQQMKNRQGNNKIRWLWDAFQSKRKKAGLTGYHNA